MSRTIRFIPKDRTLNRAAWKVLDRIVRATHAVYTPDFERAFYETAVFGQAQLPKTDFARVERYLATGRL